MAYTILKFLHVLGVVLLVGNFTVTAVWKVFANRTRSHQIVAFAHRLVIATDWTFTLGGVVLVVVGGYGMVYVGQLDVLEPSWLLWSQILFLISGLIWLIVLIPIQSAQAGELANSTVANGVTNTYRKLSRRWIAWGVAATVPMVAALFLMIIKPF